MFLSYLSLKAAAEDTVASEQSLGQKLVIWGTDVNVATCKENFQVSLCTLKLSPETLGEGIAYM